MPVLKKKIRSPSRYFVKLIILYKNVDDIRRNEGMLKSTGMVPIQVTIVLLIHVQTDLDRSSFTYGFIYIPLQAFQKEPCRSCQLEI